MAKMMGLNLRETTAVFLSGNGIIQANDINAVVSAMTHDGLDRRGVLVCPSSAVSEESFLNKRYKEFLEKTIVIDKTSRIGINNTDIEIVETGEALNVSAGYKFITPRFALGYLPDTPFSESLAERFSDIDILIMNVPDPKNSKRKEHIDCDDAKRIIKKANPQLVILTGFGIKMLQADPLYETREIQKETGVQVIAAKDGMTINPVSFTTTVRQRNLNSFRP
jgi:ribonuclease BN (tRNA processing enzyme)